MSYLGPINVMKRLSLILCGVAVLVVTAPSAYGWGVDFVFDDRIVEVAAQRIDGQRYVSLKHVLTAFGSVYEWDERVQSLHAQLNGKDWVFWANSAIVSIDGEARTLGFPVRMEDDEPYVALGPLVQLLDYFTDARVTMQAEEVRIERLGGTVYGYDIDSRRNGVIITLKMSGVVPHEAFQSEGNWINITLLGAHVQPRRLNARRPHRAVLEVKASQFQKSAQVSFRMREPVEKYLITENRADNSLTLLVGDLSFILGAGAVAPPNLDEGGRLGPIDLIVIDAGHGGRDTGAVGLERQIAEKDIALSIADRLARRFRRNHDIDAIVTRDDDYTLDFTERAARANEAHADLFISIHVNSSDNANTRGCQTFFLGRAHDEQARLLTEFENASDRRTLEVTSDGDSADAPYAELNRDFQSASADLAETIQRQFESSLDIPSRGVNQAEFELLNRLNMPGVMVFVGFITNPDEEELLRRRSFQTDVARAIYEAVLTYRDKMERAQAASGNQ